MPICTLPIMLPTDRAGVLTEEQATDVILHCKYRSQVPRFAAKYHMTENWIEKMRRGRGWWKLRQKLNTGWRP